MGLSELFGWSRRTPQPAGQDLEAEDRSEDTEAWKRWALRGGLFLALVALTVAAFPRGDFYEYTVEVGDTWRQSTLTAPFNFPVYLDQERVQARRDTVRKTRPRTFEKCRTHHESWHKTVIPWVASWIGFWGPTRAIGIISSRASERPRVKTPWTTSVAAETHR